MNIPPIVPYVLRDEYSYLEILDTVTGESRTVREYDACIEAPNWLRSGRILYNARGTMFSLDLETGEERHIDTGFLDLCNNDHVVSPDERWLGVTHRTKEDNLARVYILPIEGGTPVLITPLAPSFLHGWSPDGRELAFCGERNGNYDIYTIDARGGIERRLTTSPEHDDGCEYSPDGKYIWFNSARSGRMQLYRMRRDGSGQTRLLQPARNNWFPHLSPDGGRVVYLSYGDDVEPGKHPADKEVQIRMMDADGGNDRPLVELFGGQGTINVNSWSPCGRYFAYVRYRRPQSGFSCEKK